jgi:hypothetical protein
MKLTKSRLRRIIREEARRLDDSIRQGEFGAYSEREREFREAAGDVLMAIMDMKGMRDRDGMWQQLSQAEDLVERAYKLVTGNRIR